MSTCQFMAERERRPVIWKDRTEGTDMTTCSTESLHMHISQEESGLSFCGEIYKYAYPILDLGLFENKLWGNTYFTIIFS